MVGIGITYTNYGNEAVFGNCLGIYPNLQVPIIVRNRVEWTLRFGDGLAYVTRKYQLGPPVDTINTAIGSNLNDFFMFMTDVRFHLNKHWDAQFGANFTHISNADFHQPNLGVNMAGTHIGVRWFPNTSKPEKIYRELPKLPNRWLIEARLGIAQTEARSNGNPELPTYLTTVYASRRWHSKNKYYFGMDYAFHEDTYEELKYWSRFKGWGLLPRWVFITTRPTSNLTRYMKK
jgi:hypothetical protein